MANSTFLQTFSRAYIVGNYLPINFAVLTLITANGIDWIIQNQASQQYIKEITLIHLNYNRLLLLTYIKSTKISEYIGKF